MKACLLWLLLWPAPLFADAEQLCRKPDAWFRSADGKSTIDIVLSWQSEAGSWPKNQDTTRKRYEGERSKLEGTFDNKATTGELRFLARAFDTTGDARCRDAYHQGFDHIIEAQYPNGGWPQSHPPGKGYKRHITFNDGSMVRLLEFLRDAPDSGLLDAARRRRAAEAFDRGVACIVKCQIIIDGKPTVWCAQHDETTLAPAQARDYELPSLSGGESAGILRFLMTLDRPSPEVVRAVKAGVEWYESAKITGIRVDRKKNGGIPVADRDAPALWARFYDLQTGRPFFCGRDGVKKSTLAEIEKERREGYAWYGNWGESVARDFRKWRHAP